MSDATKVFVVVAFLAWADQETSLGIPMAAKCDDGSVGFFPAYRTLEEAEANWPGKEVLVAEFRKAKEDDQ